MYGMFIFRLIQAFSLIMKGGCMMKTIAVCTVTILIFISCADDVVSPTISIVNPQHQETVSGTICVTAEADDDIGVEKVEFYINDTLRTTDEIEPYAYQWNTTLEPDSTYHRIHARAYDAADNEGISQTVTVLVVNGLPFVLSQPVSR
jgi:hypothetical protein